MSNVRGRCNPQPDAGWMSEHARWARVRAPSLAGTAGGGRKSGFSNKRYPIVSLDPDLEMDITFVFVDSEAVPWLDRGIRVGQWVAGVGGAPGKHRPYHCCMRCDNGQAVSHHKTGGGCCGGRALRGEVAASSASAEVASTASAVSLATSAVSETASKLTQATAAGVRTGAG